MILSLKLLMRNVMLQNSINLMVQPEFVPMNCSLSSAFVNICQNLSFESQLSKVSLVISDYFHKTTNQLWIENLKTTGLKGCKKYQEK